MNWKDRLKRAKKSKKFTPEDVKLASLWITNPISDIADDIELREGELERGPIDIYLVIDGIYFIKGVEEDDIVLATNCYHSIIRQAEALKNGTDKITRLKKFLGRHYA